MTTDDTTTDASARSLPWWAALLIGVGAALVGLLPWIITGMRLPLQNLWASSTLPGAPRPPPGGPGGIASS